VNHPGFRFEVGGERPLERKDMKKPNMKLITGLAALVAETTCGGIFTRC